MRLLILILSILIATSSGIARQNDSLQASNQVNESDEAAAIRIVSNRLGYPPKVSISFVEKQIHRLGDRAAIGLVKIFVESDFRDSEQASKALEIIRSAFAYPDMISRQEDKEPKVALLFLTKLRDQIESSDLRVEIDSLIDFVKEQRQKQER